MYRGYSDSRVDSVVAKNTATAVTLTALEHMKKNLSRQDWIATAGASIVFLLCAITAIYYTPLEPKTRIAIAALSVVLILMCFFLATARKRKREATSLGLGYSLWSSLDICWFWDRSPEFTVVQYLALLTAQSAAWKSLGWMGMLAVGPFLVVIGLVSIMRKVILNLLNN